MIIFAETPDLRTARNYLASKGLRLVIVKVVDCLCGFLRALEVRVLVRFVNVSRARAGYDCGKG